MGQENIMTEVFLKNQKLILILFLVFAVLFGSVIIVSAVVYSRTTMYDLDKQSAPTHNIEGGFEKLTKSLDK